MKTIENPCLNCIQPCVSQDGECTGPVTEEQQKAINASIVYQFEHDIANARRLAPELVKAALRGDLEADEYLPLDISPTE